MYKSKMYIIFENEFRHATNAAQTTGNVIKVFEQDESDEHAGELRSSGNFDEPHGQPENQVDNEKMKVEVDVRLPGELGHDFTL